MQAQPVFSSYINSYVDEEQMYGNSTYLNNQYKKMPTSYIQPQQQMGYPNQYQGHGVRIEDEDGSYGVGGMWGLEHMTMEGTQKSYPEPYGYSRPSLYLATTFEEPSWTPQSQFYMDSAISTAHPDMATYSNESSPFMNNYMLPSAPRTPVTPATTPLLNGHLYTAPGVAGAFVLVPIIAKDNQGNLTTVFYPKPAMLDSCMQEDYSMGFPGSQTGYIQDEAYNMGLHCSPQSLDYAQERMSYMEEAQDDGPELVGMGLYDEPPELLYSNTSTPDMAHLNTPSSGDGRGLVLEQIFELPEEDNEDEDGEEYEYGDEEEEEAEQQGMRY